MRRFINVPQVTEQELQAHAEDQQARDFTLGNIKARLQEPLDLADKIEAGTATPADQKRALVLALRFPVRLARYQLDELDTPN